jgi:hypothetical protein
MDHGMEKGSSQVLDQRKKEIVVVKESKPS